MYLYNLQDKWGFPMECLSYSQGLLDILLLLPSLYTYTPNTHTPGIYIHAHLIHTYTYSSLPQHSWMLYFLCPSVLFTILSTRNFFLPLPFLVSATDWHLPLALAIYLYKEWNMSCCRWWLPPAPERSSMCVCVYVFSHSVMSDSLQPHGL